MNIYGYVCVYVCDAYFITTHRCFFRYGDEEQKTFFVKFGASSKFKCSC